MRSKEEITEVVKNPKEFLKSDVYKVGVVECYPYVDFDVIPEMHRLKVPEGVSASWNPEEEREHWDFKRFYLDERNFLVKLANNNEVNAAIFRTPRLLALVWLEGYDIDSFDDALFKIVVKNMSIQKAMKKLQSLYKSLDDLVL